MKLTQKIALIIIIVGAIVISLIRAYKVGATTIDPEYIYSNDIFAYPMYTTANVNMRTFPSNDSRIATVLPKNSEVDVLWSFEGWSKIVLKNNFGVSEYYYISSDYLSDEREVYTYLGDFKLTAYCSCKKCCGKWSGGPTASGKMPVAGRTVAMNDIPFGTKLIINDREYVVEDRGTPYGHVDIYFDSHAEALQFGKKYAPVYKVDRH